jgi:hypothetical protein
MTFRTLAVVAACAAGVPGLAVSQFEGVITYEYRAQGRETPIKVVQYLKDGRVRTEPQLPEAKGAYAIIDGPKQRLTSVTPERASFFVAELKPVSAPPTFTRTGKKETIAGRPCEHYTFVTAATPDAVADMCIARGMGYSGATLGRGTEGAGDMPDLLAPQVTFHLVILGDELADRRDFCLGQVLDARIGTHLGRRQDLAGARRTHAEQVGQAYFGALVARQVNTFNSRHGSP